MVSNTEEASAYSNLVDPAILKVFNESYKYFTEVQVRAGHELLNYHDVVVESPTGSGKTLAYLLPLFTLMRRNKGLGKCEFGAVILCPTRELALQIAAVAAPFATRVNYTVVVVVGGSKIEKSIKKLKDGGNILIATPGRLFQLLSLDKTGTLQRSLKTVEILIVDEADRFHETQFQIHLKEILLALPKQRRTGLFSATQEKELSDLSVFGLRNKKLIKIKESVDLVSPSSLSNFYTECKAEEKLICLVEFIRNKPNKKVLVFLPSCASVKYFHAVLKRVLKKRSLFAVHGHNSSKERDKQIDDFRRSKDAVMFSTDLMSRGIDIADIDWVIQFEIPKLSSWFVHRSGRTARCGREGNALLILSSEQSAYISYLSKHEQVDLKKISVPTISPVKAHQLREKIIRIVCADRELLEAGTRAFVCHIQSYVKHDCNIVCSLKDLDIPGLAHSYGLLRLPRMKELSWREDLSNFRRSDIDTSTIKYANPLLERKRTEIMSHKHKKKVEALKMRKNRNVSDKLSARNRSTKKNGILGVKKKSKAVKRKLEQSRNDVGDNNVSLPRKMKKV